MAPIDDAEDERESSRAEQAAIKTAETQRRRNLSRLKAADERDTQLLGELEPEGNEEGPARRGENESRDQAAEEKKETNNQFLDPRTEAFFPPPTEGPDDEFETPPWFLDELRKLARTMTKTPGKSPIVFQNNAEAAKENGKLLEKMDFDIGRLITEFRDTTLGYGSEFRTVEQLRPLLGRHPHFFKLAQILTYGMPYVFTSTLDDSTRSAELHKLLARGNHKSAKAFPEQVDALLTKDVTHGFSIPVPVNAVPKIPHAAVQPLGLAQQWTLDENGVRCVKFRMTQDLSFATTKTGPPISINDRIDMTAYAEMIYGWCLSRITHFVVAIRLKFPTRVIFISKYDYSDAYRRIAHSAEAAAQTIAVQGGIAYISLRLTFGGSPNPPTWCLFSEIVTDLANEISRCTAWEPEALRSPAQEEAPLPIRMDQAIPFASGRPMAVGIPITDAERVGRVDGFIDDLINVFVDSPENCRRQPHVVPLAMHVTSRPHAGEKAEPITRRALLSLPKLIAEGGPTEVQTVLGWRIDTRRLLISLPDDKFRAWVADIEGMEKTGECRYQVLDQLVGRLNHASQIIPPARHFLSRIRATLRPRRHKTRKLSLGREVVADIALWKTILAEANRGISLNLMVTRQPDRICWSDACPFGLGGYSLSGRAWRIRIPPNHELRGHAGVNNLLEFMGMVINVWLECDAPDSQQSCILAIGDSTSAIGWLFKSSKLDPSSGAFDAHLVVARHLATLLTTSSCCLASQHIRGESNVVADLLSFTGSNERGKPHPLAADHPPNDVLTQRFRDRLPSQVPENFRIYQLPDEIISWVRSVLQIAISSLGAAKRRVTKGPTESGDDGLDSASTPETLQTLSSFRYPSSNESFLPKLSCSAIGQPIGPPAGTLQESVRSRWSQALSDRPQATWLRRFGAISGKAPCTSKGTPTCDPSSGPY